MLLYVLLALVLEESEILVSFLQCVMLAIEGMNYIVLFWVDLILQIDVLLNEINELLHSSYE